MSLNSKKVALKQPGGQKGRDGGCSPRETRVLRPLHAGRGLPLPGSPRRAPSRAEGVRAETGRRDRRTLGPDGSRARRAREGGCRGGALRPPGFVCSQGPGAEARVRGMPARGSPGTGAPTSGRRVGCQTERSVRGRPARSPRTATHPRGRGPAPPDRGAEGKRVVPRDSRPEPRGWPRGPRVGHGLRRGQASVPPPPPPHPSGPAPPDTGATPSPAAQPLPGHPATHHRSNSTLSSCRLLDCTPWVPRLWLLLGSGRRGSSGDGVEGAGPRGSAGRRGPRRARYRPADGAESAERGWRRRRQLATPGRGGGRRGRWDPVTVSSAAAEGGARTEQEAASGEGDRPLQEEESA